MNNRKLLVVLLTLCLIAALVIGLTRPERTSPEFSRVKQLQESLLSDEGLSDLERQKGWTEVKQLWPKLSAHEQQTLKHQLDRKKREQIHRFFELESETDRIAYLDRVIDEFDEQAVAKKKQARQVADGKKKAHAQKSNFSRKQNDPEAMRDGLRKHLDANSADERARERIYWTALKERWAERHRHEK